MPFQHTPSARPSALNKKWENPLQYQQLTGLPLSLCNEIPHSTLQSVSSDWIKQHHGSVSRLPFSQKLTAKLMGLMPLPFLAGLLFKLPNEQINQLADYAAENPESLIGRKLFILNQAFYSWLDRCARRDILFSGESKFDLSSLKASRQAGRSYDSN